MPLPSQPSHQLVQANSFTTGTDGGAIWPYHTYKSSKTTSPTFQITQNGEVSDGLMFLTMANIRITGNPGVKEEAAIMMTPAGDLVWSSQPASTSNFRVQSLYNESVITDWTGVGAAASSGGAAHGYEQVKIIDSTCKTIYTVCPKLDITFPPGESYACVADVHESYMTESGTMLVTVYNLTQTNLTSVGGLEHGWVLNPLAVEVDIRTSKPVFIWSALDHVPLYSSHVSLGSTGNSSSNPCDWFHMNSIQFHGGNYLINSRQTRSSYYVNRSGEILWEINVEMGGDFGSLPPGAKFPSVGLSIILDLPPNKEKSPTIATHLVNANNKAAAYAEGSLNTCENGNYFMGYGVLPFATEYGQNSSTGADVLWSAQFAYNNLNNTASSYRAYKQIWHGTPTSKLSFAIAKAQSNDKLATCANGSTLRDYVSWNGATDVSQYNLYTGATANTLTKYSTFAKKGYGTKFVIPKAAKHARVTAVQEGKEVGSSKVETI